MVTLLVPMSFGFTYMMIHLARDAERKAKLAKEKGPQKIAPIELSEKWINWVLIGLIGFQVFLNIAAYNAFLTGMNNLSLFFAGLILIVFAGLFHVYRYGMSKATEIPPPPRAALPELKPKAISEDATISETKALPESTGGDKKELPKAPQETPPQIKTDSLGPDMKKETSVGTTDLNKP
jgi:ubiquinol-cytochrome c reductase cytochrome b subunit